MNKTAENMWDEARLVELWRTGAPRSTVSKQKRRWKQMTKARKTFWKGVRQKARQTHRAQTYKKMRIGSMNTRGLGAYSAESQADTFLGTDPTYITRGQSGSMRALRGSLAPFVGLRRGPRKMGDYASR